MQWEPLSRDQMTIPGDPKTLSVTPYFRYESVFNEPKSKIEGKPIHDLIEVVELRFAANSNYKPVFGVSEMCEMDDNGRIITWAERYKPQYQAFQAGSEQIAEGTPLEELLPYGMSQARLSLCRALDIYSVEALANLQGPARKKLGQHGNDIIPMAERYMEDRRGGAQMSDEVAELKRQLAELQAAQAPNPFSSSIPETPPALPDGYEDMTEAQLKDEIERITEARPKGNPSRGTLVTMLNQALAA